MVLVAGDREEAISTTMSAAFLDIPVAHFFGGDIANDGNIDNSVRYAVLNLHIFILQL
ncbi:MAG: UDP-N-acetylglucosamine 2-epimerase [Saprospiraceae bacterium]|nr:UDP-N-acetylglucosamine 2-epimerase [Saprospiraceae bacterium]